MPTRSASSSAEVDRTLAGFARGQATVCLALAVFYGIGLTLIGVDFGLAVGIGDRRSSPSSPIVGSITGFVVSVGIALAQFDRLAAHRRRRRPLRLRPVPGGLCPDARAWSAIGSGCIRSG